MPYSLAPCWKLTTGYPLRFVREVAFWLASIMGPETKTWRLFPPMALMGIGSVPWGPIVATATMGEGE